LTEHLRVSSKHAIAETIEGEAIIIHLGTGAYYSLRDAGADIWAAMEQGATHEEIVDALAARYDGARDDIAVAVARVIDDLRREGLVEETAGASTSRLLLGPPPETPRPFSPPSLEKHTDMQDLILIDPVHEVDARGWPHAQVESER
jgi:hypothetical protein